MHKGKFCPKCGKTTEPFIKGFCKDCFLKEREPVLLPETIKLSYCLECSKAKVIGRQVPLDNELVTKSIKQKIKVKKLLEESIDINLKMPEEGKAEAQIIVKGIADSVPILIEKTIPIELVPEQCDACMKIKSNYWEAKVQLRSKQKTKLQKAFTLLQQQLEFQRKKDGLSAIVKVEGTKQMPDVLIGSSKAAANATKYLRKKLGAEIKKSFKLIGVDKQGRDKKRITFSVRF